MSFYSFYFENGVEYILTKTVRMYVDRIKYERLDDDEFKVKYYLEGYCQSSGRARYLAIDALKYAGWSQRSIGIRGQVLSVYPAREIEVPVYTTEPDRDVPAMFVDERKL